MNNERAVGTNGLAFEHGLLFRELMIRKKKKCIPLHNDGNIRNLDKLCMI